LQATAERKFSSCPIVNVEHDHDPVNGEIYKQFAETHSICNFGFGGSRQAETVVWDCKIKFGQTKTRPPEVKL